GAAGGRAQSRLVPPAARGPANPRSGVYPPPPLLPFPPRVHEPSAGRALQPQASSPPASSVSICGSLNERSLRGLLSVPCRLGSRQLGGARCLVHLQCRERRPPTALARPTPAASGRAVPVAYVAHGGPDR